MAVAGCHINKEMRVSILRCGGVDKLIGGHIICIDVGNSEHQTFVMPRTSVRAGARLERRRHVLLKRG